MMSMGMSLVGAILADTTPPIISDGTLTASNETSSSFDVSYTQAEDDTPGAITYTLYTSTSDNVNNVVEMEENGTEQESADDVSTLSASGLSALTTYHFNVKAEDTNGNKSAYTSNSTTTTL